MLDVQRGTPDQSAAGDHPPGTGVKSPAVSSALAIAGLAAAVLLRWVLDPLMGETLPLVTLFGAVAGAVWLGGYRPAIVVGVLGYFACDYLFIQPRGRIGLFELGHVVGLIAYLFTCSLIIAFGEAMRLAQIRASEQRELLRVTLGSIGDAVISTDINGNVTYLNSRRRVLDRLDAARCRAPAARNSPSDRQRGDAPGGPEPGDEGSSRGGGGRPGESHGSDSERRRRAAD